MQHQIIFYKTAFIYQRELEGLRKKIIVITVYGDGQLPAWNSLGTLL